MAQNVVVPPFDVAPDTVVGASPQSAFPFDFPFWEVADIRPYKDGVPLAVHDYLVEGFFLQNGQPVEGGFGSGQITLNIPVSNCTITIDRFVDSSRRTQFSRSAPLGMPPLNADLNKLTARQQDLVRRIDRAVAEAGSGIGFIGKADKAANGSDFADPDAVRANIGADQAANVGVNTLDAMLAAPAYSLARSERGRVDGLRAVPDLAMARAGSIDIAPYLQSVFDEFGAVDVWLDGGAFRWGQMVTLPEGGYLKAEGGKALIRPLAALGACTDAAGGFAISIDRSYSGVRGLRWDGGLAGQAGAVVIDCGQITGVPGSGVVHDVVASEMEADDMAALVWDRGAGGGTANVGRHYVTWVQNNVARRQRGPAFRLRYGLGHLNYNGERKNIVGFQGSSSPNHAALDADFSALSALSDAGGVVILLVAEGAGPGNAAQHGIRLRNGAAAFLETGCYFDGLGGSAADIEDFRAIWPGHVQAAYCDGHGFRFKNVYGVQGGFFDVLGRQGLPGSTADRDAFRLEGDCTVFEVENVKSDSATGHAVNRLVGSGTNRIGRIRAENGGRRAIQMSGAGGGVLRIDSASANNNNLTSADATPNWETTSPFDRIFNYQLPSGAVVDVTTPGTG